MLKSETETVLKIRNLRVEAGNKCILDDLNLDIFKNRVNTIVGPSGGGKSTLLRCLNKLTDLDPAFRVSGEILFEELNQNTYDEVYLRREIGFVFQKPNPFPMSIYDNVAFGVRINANVEKSVLDKMVQQSLEEVGLYEEVKDDLNRSATTLSGGQQQRLCIARALVLRPKVIMMDEPTSSLDPLSKSKIEDLIRDLSEKYTIILVTHDMRQARQISDYLNLINNGTIEKSEAIGFCEEVLA